MKDRFVLRYNQRANESKGSETKDSGQKRLESPAHRYLHDHRAKDALLEYLDDLET